MSEVVFRLKMDDDVYPYWIGVTGLTLSGRSEEEWCETQTQRGYDYSFDSDPEYGPHYVFQFISRTDALRFILCNPTLN